MQMPAPLLILLAVCLYGVIAGANVVATEDDRHGWRNLGRWCSGTALGLGSVSALIAGWQYMSSLALVHWAEASSPKAAVWGLIPNLFERDSRRVARLSRS
jgi:hypothetical protein